MPDVVTLTINPAVDIFVNVEKVEPTRKMRCSAPKRDPGGGGINVARVAQRLGSDVAAIYPIGGAIGKLLQRLVEREGIPSIVTPSHVETRENFTAFEEDSGVQYRFVLPGSALHRAEWEACLDKLASLPPRPKFVVASGSVPPGVPEDFFAQVARIAKGLGAKVVIDTSGPALGAALDEHVFLVKPNLNELSELVGAALDADDVRVAACRKLTASGQAQAVALTLGEEGALLVTADRAWRAQPMTIEVVSAVGAGDSFLGGMVASLAAGKPLEEAFRVAVAAGSAAVLSPGTDLCREAEVKRLMADVRISEVEAAVA
ncbi:MAG: 1-phosphofructokinase family hexose kinase [Deltaproteobacteria bacterium]|nr:1-phosphofructokinase family hexose kinase [Deltaproteobacteria bacterium]